MEAKTCEEYVLGELAAALVENERLKQRIAEAKEAEPTAEVVRINEPVETCYLRIADRYDFKGDNGLGMTAAEIREACGTREGLERIAKKELGSDWSKKPALHITKDIYPYQLKTCSAVFGINVYNDGESIIEARIMGDSEDMDDCEHFPIERLGEMREYGLETLKANLLVYAEDLEADECSK